MMNSVTNDTHIDILIMLVTIMQQMEYRNLRIQKFKVFVMMHVLLPIIIAYCLMQYEILYSDSLIKY